MKTALKRFLVRFRAANGLDRRPERFRHAESHRTPRPDIHLAEHYRPTPGAFPMSGGGGQR